MIGQLSDLGRQKSVLPAAVVRALDALRRLDLDALEAGRFELEGDKLYYMIQDVDTRSFDESRPEAAPPLRRHPVAAVRRRALRLHAAASRSRGHRGSPGAFTKTSRSTRRPKTKPSSTCNRAPTSSSCRTNCTARAWRSAKRANCARPSSRSTRACSDSSQRHFPASTRPPVDPGALSFYGPANRAA